MKLKVQGSEENGGLSKTSKPSFLRFYGDEACTVPMNEDDIGFGGAKVDENGVAREWFVILNSSHKLNANVTLSSEDVRVSIEPSRFELKPREKKKISFSCNRAIIPFIRSGISIQGSCVTRRGEKIERCESCHERREPLALTQKPPLNIPLWLCERCIFYKDRFGEVLKASLGKIDGMTSYSDYYPDELEEQVKNMRGMLAVYSLDLLDDV